jgi:hypothetical protein
MVGDLGQQYQVKIQVEPGSPLKGESQLGVRPGFEAKTRCSSYVCPGSSCHTHG